jgi:glycosyltransferase involved in cell wall biosynthesis
MKFIFSNYDSPKNPYYNGGGASAIHKIASSLSAKHDVTVIAGSFPNANNEIIDHVKYRYIGLPWLGTLNQLVYILTLPYYVLTSSFDLWVESFIPPFSSTFVPFWTKQKVVGFAQLLSAHDFSKKYFHLPFPVIERLALRRYKHIIALSNSVVTRIKSISPSCEVLNYGLGYDPIISSASRSTSQPYFLFLGRIDLFQKGLDILVDIYAKYNIKTKLLIAGSGIDSEVAKLKRLIADNHLNKKVFLLGRVERDKKHDLLANALATIVPSRYETFSLSALESMVHGAPVIYSDLPDLKWIPAISGLSFALNQPAQLAKLLLDFSRRHPRSLGSRAKIKQSVSHLAWSKLLPRYRKYLIQLGASND